MPEPLPVRMERVESILVEFRGEFKKINARLDDMYLNGHGPDIKAVAEMRPALDTVVGLIKPLSVIVEKLSGERLDSIVQEADKRVDDVAFWRVLKRKIRWERITGPWAKTIVGGFLSGSALLELFHLITTGHL